MRNVRTGVAVCPESDQEAVSEDLNSQSACKILPKYLITCKPNNNLKKSRTSQTIFASSS